MISINYQDVKCMLNRLCMHAWVYGHLPDMCVYMCTHAYMYFYVPPCIEVGRAWFAPPPPILKSVLRLCMCIFFHLIYCYNIVGGHGMPLI